MKPTRETIQPSKGSSFSCLDIDQAAFDSHYHFHPEFEITWIVESDGQRLIGDAVVAFAAGDLVLIGSNVPHQYRNWRDGRARARVIQFPREMLGGDLLRLPEFLEIGSLLGEAARGLTFTEPACELAFKQIEELFDLEPGAQKVARLVELLETLAADSDRAPVASEVYAKPVKARKMDRLERVLNYLERHWQESIALSDVAHVAALHPQSMSRFFRQHLGMNFQEYVLQLRISRAAQMLIETERTVADIAFDCGFNNLSNFNQQFKRIKGSAPSLFRKGQERV